MPEKRSFRVTSFDVAEAAGVSQSTVSRALAGDTSISEPTRARVREAAEKLNYQVDENAARLRRGAKRYGELCQTVSSYPLSLQHILVDAIFLLIDYQNLKIPE